MTTLTDMSKQGKVGLTLAVVLCIAFTAWRIVYGSRIAEMDALFVRATNGDVPNLEKLISYRSSHANDLLRRMLLSEEPSLADPEIVARALIRHGALDRSQLAAMLAVNAPPRAQYAAYRIFMIDGCDLDCQQAALQELRDLHSGQKTDQENRLLKAASTFDGSNAEKAQWLRQQAKKARDMVERNALALLGANPCETLNLIRSAETKDQEFTNWLDSQLQLRTNCP